MQPESLSHLADLVKHTADSELPRHLSRGAGSRKADGSLVTAFDRRMQDALVAALGKEWPDYALLGEEMEAGAQQQALARRGRGVWCIDPLDGTTNYAGGIPYYAVSVALLREGRVELGVVYDPARGECFTAARGQGAWCNAEPLRSASGGVDLSQAVALVDFKRLAPALARRLATNPPYQSQRSFGAVALDWCWLAAGRCDIYLHGRQKLWDYAAGCLILEEAGGRALTLEGEAVYQPQLAGRSAAAALDPGLFRQWAGWLGIEQPNPLGDGL